MNMQKLLGARNGKRERDEHRRRLKVALVGCGAVANAYYAPALRALERANELQVMALADPDTQNLLKVHKLFPNARRLADLDNLLQLGVDLALVASPPHVHAEQTIRLLESGIAVLCEKPMATCAAEAQAMIAAAEKSGGMLAVGLVRRFFPAAQMIHQLLLSKALGEVHSFSYAEGERFRWPAQSASFFQRETAKGGVLLDIGVHVLDLLTWWWGQPLGVAYADDAMGGVEANCRIEPAFAEGHTGEVRLSRDCHLSNQMVIFCERGIIRWPVGEVSRLEITFDEDDFSLDGTVHQRALAQPINTFEHCFVEQLRNVVSATQGLASPVVAGVDALPSLHLIEQCYRQRTLMDMGWLSDIEQARARQLHSAYTP